MILLSLIAIIAIILGFYLLFQKEIDKEGFLHDKNRNIKFGIVLIISGILGIYMSVLLYQRLSEDKNIQFDTVKIETIK